MKEDGVWRTIKGRHVFIKDGQSLSEALKNKKEDIKPKETDEEKRRRLMKELQDTVDRDTYLRYVDRTAKKETPTDEIEKWLDLEKKKNSNGDYELYKRAKLYPDSIDAMTENSTDWEELDKKYSGVFEREKVNKIKNQYATNNESGADDNTSMYAQKSIDYWKDQKAKVEAGGGDASWDDDNIRRWEEEKEKRLKGEAHMDVNPKELQKNAYDNLLKEQGRREEANKPKDLQSRLRERIRADYNPEIDTVEDTDLADLKSSAEDAMEYLDYSSSYDDFDDAVNTLEGLDYEDTDASSQISDAAYELGQARELAYDVDKMRTVVEDNTTLEDIAASIENDAGSYGRDCSDILEEGRDDLVDLLKDEEITLTRFDSPDEYEDMEEYYDYLKEQEFDDVYSASVEDYEAERFTSQYNGNQEKADRLSRSIEGVYDDTKDRLKNEADEIVDEMENDISNHIDDAKSYIDDIEIDVDAGERGLKVEESRPIAEKLALQEKIKGRAIVNTQIADLKYNLDNDYIGDVNQGMEYIKGAHASINPNNSLQEILEIEKNMSGGNLTSMEDYLKKVNAQTMRRLGNHLLSEQEVIEMYMKNGMSRNTAMKMAKKYLKQRSK